MSHSSANATEVYDIYALRSYLNEDYCIIAYLSVVFYECIITLDDEIGYVWRYRRTATTLLLLSNRCFLIAYALTQLPFPQSDYAKKFCLVLGTLQYIVNAFGYLNLAVFSALRIYAISARKWCYALIILVLGLSAPGVELYYGITVTGDAISKLANVNICAYSSAGKGNGSIMSTAIFIACLVVSESSVAIATWVYTSHWMKYVEQPGSRGLLVTRALFVNGAIYFLTFLLTTIVIAVMSLTPIVWVEGYVANFLTTLPNILLSRFIHNLRQASISQGTDVGIDQLDTSQTSVCFASGVIGNIGEPLNYGSFRDSETNDDYGDEEDAEYAEAEDSSTGSGQDEILQTMSTRPV